MYHCPECGEMVLAGLAHPTSGVSRFESQSRDTQEAMADSAEDRREAARRGELEAAQRGLGVIEPQDTGWERSNG